jgi:hypothetical protein
MVEAGASSVIARQMPIANDVVDGFFMELRLGKN